MSNTQSLLTLYTVEKNSVDLSSEPFPEFAEWKTQYLAHRASIGHNTVDIDGLMDTKKSKKSTKKSKPKTKKVVDVKPELVDTVPQVIKQEEQKMEQKVEQKVEQIVEPKTHRAARIYQEMMINGVHPKRSDVIKRFMSECNMSNAGASTYQYNMKKKFSQQAQNETVSDNKKLA